MNSLTSNSCPSFLSAEPETRHRRKDVNVPFPNTLELSEFLIFLNLCRACSSCTDPCGTFVLSRVDNSWTGGCSSGQQAVPRLGAGWKDIWISPHMDLLMCVAENRHYQPKTQGWLWAFPGGHISPDPAKLDWQLMKRTALIQHVTVNYRKSYPYIWPSDTSAEIACFGTTSPWIHVNQTQTSCRGLWECKDLFSTVKW